VALFATVAVTFLVTFIVPKYVQLFQELGIQELPTTTTVIYWLARHQGLSLSLILVPAVLLLTIYLAYRRTQTGLAELDALKLRVPVLGDIVRAAALGRVSAAMAVMTRNRVPLAAALELAGGAAGSIPLEQAMRVAQRGVREGHPLARGLESSAALPATFIWRTAVGEQTGQLPEAFQALADHYQAMTRNLIRHFSSQVEPILITIIAIFVGLIVMGLFAPILSLIRALAG
jgi:type IV pilus assembly protein PilC